MMLTRMSVPIYVAIPLGADCSPPLTSSSANPQACERFLARSSFTTERTRLLRLILSTPTSDSARLPSEASTVFGRGTSDETVEEALD